VRGAGAREAAVAFAEAFCAGELDRLEAMLHPDLRLRGPLFAFDSRAAYLQSLRDQPVEPGPCTLLRVHGDGEEAAVLYEYGKPGSPVLVAQFMRLADGLIVEIRLVFDTAGLGR
jgi:hypothetical protein